MRQYAVFYVAELEGKRFELPVVLPTVPGRGRWGEECRLSKVIGGAADASSQASMLCVAFNYEPLGSDYYYRDGPWIAKGEFNYEFKTPVPVGKDVVVKTHFELRRALTNEVLKVYAQRGGVL